MRHVSLRRVFPLFVLLAWAGVAAAEPLAQRVEDHRNDIGEIDKRGNDFIHRASGFAYPMALAEMPARKTVTYGPGDAAVYYTLFGGANGDPWIDLYVYPATLEMAAEKHEIENALVNGDFKAKPTTPPASLPSLPAGGAEGWYEGFAKGAQYLTGYRFVRSGDWYVKVRVSVPAKGGQAAVERALRGLAAVPWNQELHPAAMIPKATAAIGEN